MFIRKRTLQKIRMDCYCDGASKGYQLGYKLGQVESRNKALFIGGTSGEGTGLDWNEISLDGLTAQTITEGTVDSYRFPLDKEIDEIIKEREF